MGVEAKVYIENVVRPEKYDPIPVEIARVDCGNVNRDSKISDMLNEFFTEEIDYTIWVDRGELSGDTDENPYGGKITRCRDNDGLRDWIEMETSPCSRWKMVSRIMDCIPSEELDNVEILLYLY